MVAMTEDLTRAVGVRVATTWIGADISVAAWASGWTTGDGRLDTDAKDCFVVFPIKNWI